MIDMSLIGSSATNKTENARRKGMSTLAYITLMDQLNTRLSDLTDRLAQTREHAAALEDQLRAEYGDDFLGDAAQMYLSEDRLASLDGLSGQELEAQSRELLMKQMLNDDGSIKEEYADLTVARLMSKYWLVDHLELRIDDVQRAIDSGDPAAIAEAVKREDELGDDTLRMSVKESNGIGLTKTFDAHANPSIDHAAAAIEALEVAEATPAQTRSLGSSQAQLIVG